jgi:TPR repeat protein
LPALLFCILSADEIYWKKVCNKENAFSCGMVGYLYYQGKNIEQNYSKSFEHFEKSCNGKDIGGCLNLGNPY